MARVAAYTHTVQDLELPELLVLADDIRELMDHPGWRPVVEAIAAHRERMYARLLNESTKPEEVVRLRGLLSGLASMQEAAETILELAREREREAQQETANV